MKLLLWAGGESASGCVCVVFCGEWRRVSFRGAKGNGGESALELGVVVVYFLFLGAGASQLLPFGLPNV